ncbi:hypothetical protein [Candidatus Endomicrobiellum trichonymphae]|nr:hypothetical protein [Candidatus Endomicrobium trichonymphae]
MSDEAVHFTDGGYVNACWFTLTYDNNNLPILPQYGKRSDEIKEQLKILKSYGRRYAKKSSVYNRHSYNMLPTHFEHRVNPNEYCCGCEHNELVRELNKYSTFRKLDVQTFIKDLRDYLSYHRNLKIRCFYCGEYGNILDRPHCIWA